MDITCSKYSIKTTPAIALTVDRGATGIKSAELLLSLSLSLSLYSSRPLPRPSPSSPSSGRWPSNG